MWVQLLTTCSNVLKQPNGELLVAVNHNQLRTMASETVDPIDWSHHPPSWAVPLERHVHSINQCNLAGLERATAACEATTLPMRPLRVCNLKLVTYPGCINWLCTTCIRVVGSLQVSIHPEYWHHAPQSLRNNLYGLQVFHHCQQLSYFSYFSVLSQFASAHVHDLEQSSMHSWPDLGY